ncbi:MAG: hypothetical protein IJC43_07410 [Clostridia bacterium]|nr:hypothetical protein [Clostridia bacterium]
MSQIEKLKRKFFKKPIPTDMTFDEIEKLATYYGCVVKRGGKHPFHVMHPPSGRVIPIPTHGKTVGESYVKQLKQLFDEIAAQEEK